MIRAIIRFLFRNKGCTVSWCPRPDAGKVKVAVKGGAEMTFPFCEAHKMEGMKMVHDSLAEQGFKMPNRFDMFEKRQKGARGMVGKNKLDGMV